jgi:hypothetical protein
MVSTRLIEQDSFGPSAALVEHFLVAIEHKKPIWWYSVVRGFRTSSQDPGWSEALAAVEAARNVNARRFLDEVSRLHLIQRLESPTGLRTDSVW